MKRYRVLGFDIDAMASTIKPNDPTTWEFIVTRFGPANAQIKAQNLVDLGNAPFSILAFHNKFLRQTRDAFVQGAYYPALTGACALGERILNHMIIRLRDDFKETPEYKRVHGKNQFDDWDVPINALSSWGVMLPEVKKDFKKLKTVRHRKAIHFNPETDNNDREYALEALTLLSDIIQQQFSAFGPQPWFIPNIPGCSFIKKDYETKPFIKALYIPNCVYVGPDHHLETRETKQGIMFVPIDSEEYPNEEISDTEFAERYKNKQK